MDKSRDINPGSRDGRGGAAATTQLHPFRTPTVREWTPQEIARQRDLVLMSLMPRRRPRNSAT